MLIRIFKMTIIGFILSSTLTFAQEGIYFNAAKGNKEAVFNTMVHEKIEGIGFKLSSFHERINDVYKKKYGTKGKTGYDSDYEERLDSLGFFSISNDKELRSLLLKEPRLGAFSPFNLYMYKYIDKDITRVGHLNPELMLDIVDVKDKGVRNDFIKMFAPIDSMVNAEIGGKGEVISFDKLPAKKLLEFELKFQRTDNLYDFIDAFQEQFEEALDENRYIVAGFKDFSEVYADREEEFSKYDTYFVYSLCSLRFSYEIFNHGNAQAGAFAPCTMYMYIEKGSSVMKIGMVSLENWISVAGVKDASQVKEIRRTEGQIIEIMTSLGAKLK